MSKLNSELSEQQAIALVRERFPNAVADHDAQGWYVRAINADGDLYGFLGRAPTGPEAWMLAAQLMRKFDIGCEEDSYISDVWGYSTPKRDIT